MPAKRRDQAARLLRRLVAVRRDEPHHHQDPAEQPQVGIVGRVDQALLRQALDRIFEARIEPLPVHQLKRVDRELQVDESARARA